MRLKSGIKGLRREEKRAGTLIAFATDPGATATDEGVYAEALADELQKPGVEAGQVFRSVRRRVLEATANRKPPQFPSFVDERVDDFYFKEGEKGPELALNAPKRVTASQKPAEEACDGLLVSVALSGETPCIKPGSGQSFKDCADCPEMVVVPAGRFMMGSTQADVDALVKEFGKDNEKYFKWETPQHRVTIAQPFAVGQFSVTRGQFAKFVKATGYKAEEGCLTAAGTRRWVKSEKPSWRSPRFDQGDDHPVVCVNWNDATAYAHWLSKSTGRAYRLLSEVEFEYAARAGTTTQFWWGNAISTSQANYDNTLTYVGGAKGAFLEKTMPVQSFQPNPWGLYQVHGNVWSWTQDCLNDSYKDASTDGSAWTSGDCERRLIRGGSWLNNPEGLRADRGAWNYSYHRNLTDGFRVARTF